MTPIYVYDNSKGNMAWEHKRKKSLQALFPKFFVNLAFYRKISTAFKRIYL